jgi:hypothetical protein
MRVPSQPACLVARAPIRAVRGGVEHERHNAF